MKLLDVPTGSGALAAEATRRGAHVVGVDISSGMVAQARKLHPGIEFRVGDVEHLPVADGTLDAVVCAFGLGHFPYPEASVAECMRTLKPGGRIAFSWWDASDKQRIQGLIRDAVAEVGAEAAAGLAGGPLQPAVLRRRRVPAPAAKERGSPTSRLQDHSATHLVPDVDALWNGALEWPRAHVIADRLPGCADAGGHPGGAGAEGRRLQDRQGAGAAGRLQSWSGAETGLSVPATVAAFARSAVTDP